jgi:hypothetical protein
MEDNNRSIIRPNKRTLFLRYFLPWQIYRFIVINIKMLEMMFKSH